MAISENETIMVVSGVFPDDDSRLVKIKALERIDLDVALSGFSWEDYSEDAVVSAEAMVCCLIDKMLVVINEIPVEAIGDGLVQDMVSVESTEEFKLLMRAIISNNRVQSKIQRKPGPKTFVQRIKGLFKYRSLS